MMPDEFEGVPELTLSLRSFGSARGRANEEQSRFFAPLLDARRRAAGAKTPAEAVAAFNVSRLGAALDETVRVMAAQRHPARPPARRALEATLGDAVIPLSIALRALREKTPAPPPNVAITDAEWRAWLAALRSTFEVADRVWGAVDGMLQQHPLPSRGGTSE